MTSLWSRVLAVAVLAAGAGSPALAQEGEDEEEEEEETETIESFTEGFERQDGLFPLYTDPESGKLYLEVAEDQLGDEFIYFLYTENGTPSVGHFRGAFRDNRVMTLSRRYDEIEIAAENTRFAFDPENALSRASEANITRAPLAIAGIEAETPGEEGARYLIDATAIFASEELHQVKPSQRPGATPGEEFVLGNLDKDKTRIVSARAYPENTDIVVEYVYDNDSPVNYGGEDVTDARSVAITVQHTFVAMPENGYEPRRDDFRVGYFGERITDLTDTGHTPYADVISRWNLVKQDPEAPVSDPVEPIVWWIENTTPHELRDAIREGVLAWNSAFEAAGFTNAIEVRVQPDDADWDAGDIRYNVLRWTSSPTPPFGGYGPSFTNPRTGQIIGADIMLEYVFLTNRIRYSEIFEAGGLPDWVGTAVAEMTGAPVPASGHDHALPGEMCNVAGLLQAEMIGAMAMLQAQGASQIEVDKLMEDSIRYLILHEVGHTLGLNHNMAASYGVALADLHGSDQPVSSVMDYPALNIAADGEVQGHFAPRDPGPYDVWAIQFGYTPDEAVLPGLLARSTDPTLIFGNDADDMRAPGRHIDPRVNINDLSDDPVGWAEQRVAMINDTLAVLPERFAVEGETYQGLYNSYLILTGQRFGAANVASRHVGGIYNNRAAVGQPGAETPFVPVPRELQERALAVVADGLFAPDAFAAEEAFADRLQRQRRMFDHFGTDEDPGLHARALGMQLAVLAHLTHENVLERMTDSRRYGGEYPVAEYMADLTAAIFDADIGGEVNTYRQNLQVAYLTRLIAIADGSAGAFDPVARSAALASIDRVKGQVAPGWFGIEAGSAEARAHRAHLRRLIADFEAA